MEILIKASSPKKISPPAHRSLEAGIFSAVRITLIQEQGGEDRPLTFRAAAEGSCDYLGTDVYPFSPHPH